MSTPSWSTRIRPLSAIRRGLSGMLLVLAFGALALGGYQVATGRWHATPVLSGSMRPGLQPGDVVVTQRVPISDLHVRDVIVFHPPKEPGRQTVHRIVKLTVKKGATSITTRGDANTINDPIVSSLSGATAYRVVRIVPLVGYPAVWLQNGNHGLLVIALGAILLIAAALVPPLLRGTKRSNDLEEPKVAVASAQPATDPAVEADEPQPRIAPPHAAARLTGPVADVATRPSTSYAPTYRGPDGP